MSLRGVSVEGTERDHGPLRMRQNKDLTTVSLALRQTRNSVLACLTRPVGMAHDTVRGPDGRIKGCIDRCAYHYDEANASKT